MRAGCFQSRYSHYHDMESICQIRTGFSIQTQHFCQYHSHKHPKSQYMHAPKPHQACCVDTVDQGKCTFSATQSVFVFIPESDGTDTAREIRYKTHRTYLAKSAFFNFPQACEYAGVILVNAILVLLKQKKRFVVEIDMGFVCWPAHSSVHGWGCCSCPCAAAASHHTATTR